MNSYHLLVILCIFFGLVSAIFLALYFSTKKKLETANRLTRQLEEQTEIAVQASRAKSDFLATMSHEIRTPLNAVIGLSELELRGELPESSMENIIQIHHSGSSLLEIINDILDISKIEAGGFEFASLEYESATLISDTISLNKVRIGSRPVKFVLEIDENFPQKLLGDELRVRQILNNILSNAIKYTIKGEITLCAKSELRANEVNLCFTIRDTGIGIRQEDMGKLFNTYTQLDPIANRKIEGTGLGLVITKNLVEMMGGKIFVESEYGKGSVFTVEIIQGIPLAGTKTIGDETAEKLRSFSYAAARKDEDVIRFMIPDTKVLVVDDLPANLLVARGLLKPYGLQIDTAASGQEAIEMVRRNRRTEDKQYDLILMDHMMPEMDGVEAAKVIRTWENDRQKNSEQSELNRIPIVALTANALTGMKEFYLEQGFQDYITKPVNPQLLNEAIDRLIPEHKKIAMSEEDTRFFEPRDHVNFAMVMEAQSIDILHHYLVSFTSKNQFDKAYFEKFSTIIDSINITDAEMKEKSAALKEAAQRQDAEKIGETLPEFFEFLKARQETDEGDKRQASKILSENLLRLKKAILSNEGTTINSIMGELGTINLGSSWRELYFLLNDMFLTGDFDKALGAISLWERINKK